MNLQDLSTDGNYHFIFTFPNSDAGIQMQIRTNVTPVKFLYYSKMHRHSFYQQFYLEEFKIISSDYKYREEEQMILDLLHQLFSLLKKDPKYRLKLLPLLNEQNKRFWDRAE